MIGCGPAGYNAVEGVVTLDGKPVEGAVVSFSPVDVAEGSAAVGTTDNQGLFKLMPMSDASVAGAKEGNYTVSISKAEADLSVWDVPTDAPTGAPKNLEVKLAIPAAYANTSSSGLTATVKPGKNRFEFELMKDFGSKRK